MPYLMRMNVRPDERNLSSGELAEMNRNFNMYAAEVLIHGEPVSWSEIEEVELVTAPTVGGPSSWLLGLFVNTDERYHLGIYLHRDEAVLANISKRQVLYALNAIAYYAPRPVRYKGPEGFVPLTSV
jgi:hypothetical protein